MEKHPSVRFTVFWDFFIKKIEELNLLSGRLRKNCNVLMLMSHVDDFY